MHAPAELPDIGGKVQVRAKGATLGLLQRPVMPVPQRNLIHRRIGRKLLLAGDRILRAVDEDGGGEEENEG